MWKPLVADHFLAPRADIQALQDLGLLYIPGALHNPGALIWGCPAILHINVLWALLLAGFVSCSFKRVDNSEQTIPDDSLPWQGWTDLARVGRLEAKRSTGLNSSVLSPSATTLLCPWLHTSRENKGHDCAVGRGGLCRITYWDIVSIQTLIYCHSVIIFKLILFASFILTLFWLLFWHDPFHEECVFPDFSTWLNPEAFSFVKSSLNCFVL